ncbi:uncharacterized protein B0H64DRAFT_439251 [Chaetomium fimeti]|uniref:NAD-dependent epimerase/dehydratase domain-containing protein n=1 Tax=Chaetomium fimeti TaxID=1854472 RepID=A0AAE0HLT9_9PEZI|nr:hypothetical protein B0H64DRAFT_439251 [Chaetomium fimeti]
MALTVSEHLPNKLVLVTDGAQPTQFNGKSSSNFSSALSTQFIRLGAFERVEISSQCSNQSVYRKTVKDVHAVVHAATLPGPNKPPTEPRNLTDQAVISMLESAAHEVSVGAFVYTSSLTAMVPFVNEGDTFVAEDMCNNGGRAPLEMGGAGPTQAHRHVDVGDAALLQLADIFDERISNERVLARGCYRDRDDMMRDQAITKASKTLGEEFDFEKARGEASAKVLGIFADKRWKGYGRWKEFGKTIRESLVRFDAN